MTMRLDIVTNDAGDLVRREHARDLGAGVVIGVYRLAKLAQMHDLTNQAFQRQLEQTTNTIHDYCVRAGSNVNILFAQKAVFVAGQLLKGSRAVYEHAIELGDILDWCGGSELVIMRDVTQEEMLQFAEQISAATRSERGRFRSTSPRVRLRSVDDKARLRGLEIEPMSAEQRIVRTYASAVVIMRRFFEDLQASKYILPRRIKRIAQSLVDLSEGGTAAYLGVTEARNANHDDAGKAVNSAILAVAMAREVCTDRVTLAQIAMAAMMHDVGRPRAQAVGAVPGMPQMPGVMSLSEDQEDRLPGGTAAVLTALGRVNEPSITRTVVAFESLWLRRQQWIGPVYRGARQATLHAKMISVARRYNDLMTPEPGLQPPTPDFAVATLSEELKEPSDKTVLRMLVAALGLVPVGTVLQLSTGEVCEVVPRGEPGPPDRPRVRVALDAQGGVVSQITEIDLAREPNRRVARIMSVDGWAKGLEAKTYGAYERDASGPPSGHSDSGMREAPEHPSSPSRSAVAPTAPAQRRGSTPSAVFGGVREPQVREGSSPSMSSISASASGSIGSSPSAVAEAMGRMINESLKPGAAHAQPPVALRTKPPDDMRTVVQHSPFDDAGGQPIAEIVPLGRADQAQVVDTPTARGSLDATPLAHVLVYMLDHSLSGSVIFNAPDGDHYMHFTNGVPSKVRLAIDDCLLGELLAEMGALDADQIYGIAEDAHKLGVLYGEFCVGNGHVSRIALGKALEQQLIRKVASLANLPPETGYAYYRDVSHLDAWGSAEPVLPGPLNPILATVRVWHDRVRVRATLNRIGKHPLVFHDDADLESLRPNEVEQQVLDAIVTRQCSLPQLLQMNIADEDAVSSVVYTLAVTRQFAFKGQKKAPMAARPRAPAVIPAPAARAPVSLRPLPRASTAGMAAVQVPRAPATPAAAPRTSGAPAASVRPSVVPAGLPAAVKSPSPPSVRPGAPTPPRPAPKSAPPLSEGELAVDVDLSSAASLPPPNLSGGMDDGEATEYADRNLETDEREAGLSPEMAEAERALEAMTNFRLAETALQRGDMQLAEKLARSAAEGDPEQAEYVALYAWVRAMGASPNQVADAIETISGVLQKEPTCERALLYRGKLYKRANKTKEALKDFESLMKANPKHREAASEVRLLRMHVK